MQTNMQTKNKNAIFKLNINKFMHAHEMLELYSVIFFSCKAYINKLTDAIKTTVFNYSILLSRKVALDD